MTFRSSNNLAQLLFTAAERQPEQPALIPNRESAWTYGQLADRVRRLAGALEQLGVGPGKKIGVLLYNTPAFVVSYFALLGLGATAIPLNTRLTSVELDTVLNDAHACLLISSPEFSRVVAGLTAPSLKGVILDTDLLGKNDADLEPWFKTLPLSMAFYRLDELLSRNLSPTPPFPRAMDRDAIATLIYTSGTTGRPKGVMLSHYNILTDAHANAVVIEATQKDCFITASPLFHVFGQTNIMITAIGVGARIVMVRKFSPRTVLDAMDRYRVTFLAAVPTMYIMMLTCLRERSYDLAALRVCHSGAAPMAVEVFHAVEQAFGAPVQEGYGLSEASSIVCSNPLHGVRKPGSVGLPLEGIRVQILLENGMEAVAGEIGELHVQGEIVMQGYYNRPEETAGTLVRLDDGVWLKTRDLGYQDEDGYIHIVDRVDDLINIGGVKVYPREIEEVLHRHPAIQSVAVTGVPSSLHHAEIKAFVVLHPGVDCKRETLQAFCRQSLADYKVPRHYEFVDAIPQGATGKILRKELRARQSG